MQKDRFEGTKDILVAASSLRNSPRSPRKEPPARPPADAKPRDALPALCVAVALFAFYLLTTSGRAPAGDEREYVGVSANLIALHRPVATYRDTDPDGRTGFRLDYAKYPLGQSLLALPFVWPAKTYAGLVPAQWPAFGTLILWSLPASECAGIGALLFLLFRLSARGARKMRLSRGQAAGVALVSGAATQLWPSSSTLFADTSAAFFIALCIYGLARFRRRPDSTWLWLVVATSAAAVAFSCKNTFGLAWPAVAIYATWALVERNRSCASLRPGQTRPPGRRQREEKAVSPRGVRLPLVLTVSALPFVLAIAGQLAWNRARYGSISMTGYGEGRDAAFGFNTPLWTGLYGIFFSSGRSFLLYSPLCVLGIVGLPACWRRMRAETVLVLGIAVPMILAYAKWWAWYGGWEWGSRFFLFAVPLLVWTAAPVWRSILSPSAGLATRIARRGAAAALALVSFLIQVPGVAIHPVVYWEMMARDVPVFDRPLYEKGVWEPRDDMLLAHFVPEFSPLAAQTWMLWATLNRNRLDDAALARSAPWRSLNPKWTPREVRPYLRPNVWLWTEWTRPGVSKAWLAATAGALVLILSAALAGIALPARRRT